LAKKDRDARDIRAFTPVFDGLCPRMTKRFNMTETCSKADSGHIEA
jgi:hypothetical protein